MIVQTGPRTYQLRARSTGKVLGTWPSYSGALRQERAIWAAKGRRAAGVRRNPSARRMYAQELRSGDTIEMEDLGREHVIQGPYRSARGIRFVDQHGVSLILQPNEIVRLVERENPWMATKTTKHYPQVTYTDDDAMHRWVGWIAFDGHFAMMREHRLGPEFGFGKHGEHLWAISSPREEHHFSVHGGEIVLPGRRKTTLRETVLAKEMYARLKDLVARNNPTFSIRAANTEIAEIIYTEDDGKHRWVGWIPGDDREFAIIREYRTKNGYWNAVSPVKPYYFDIENKQLVMPEKDAPPLMVAMLSIEMYERLRKIRKPTRRDW